MRVDIEGGKYTYVFEDGRARLLRYGEPSRRDVVGDKVIYCMAAEIAKLRQQLSAAQSEIESAFREGFRSPATYNDVLVNDEDEEWEKYKRRK